MEKINDRIVDITRYGYCGEGIANIDGKVVFVPFALKNEQVNIDNIIDKKSFCTASLKSIINPSNNRCEPKCKYFGICGGCDIQHMKSEEQQLFKEDMVQSNIKKYANIDICINSYNKSENEWNYRNKVVFFLTKQGKVGFLKKDSHIVIEIDKCEIAERQINSLISIFNQFFPSVKSEIYDWSSKRGNIKAIEVKHFDNNFLITILCSKDTFKNIDGLIKFLVNNKLSFGLFVCKNEKPNSVFNGRLRQIYGAKQITCQESGLKTSIKPFSFRQINNGIKERIYDFVKDEIDGNVVVDAYSGRGVLSALLSKQAKFVYAIEIEKNACEDANYLIVQNGIKNLKVLCGDCKDIILSLNNEKIDCVILDPPKSGCGDDVINALFYLNISKIIYISCSSNTLARDIKKLISKDYQIISTSIYDMFPQTCNVETVVVMNKNTK